MTCARCRRPAGWAAPGGSRWRRSSGCAARSWAPTRASCTGRRSSGPGSIGASGSTSGCRPSTTASARPRACRCWPPAAAPRSGGCWPKAAPRPSRSPSATWSATALGVRRDHNGTDRYQAVGGLVAVAFEHRMSRAGDPNSPHPRAGPERRPGSGRTLDGAGQRPAVRPADGGRSPVPGRRAGRAHPTPGCPLGAGGRTLGRGRDPSGWTTGH